MTTNRLFRSRTVLALAAGLLAGQALPAQTRTDRTPPPAGANGQMAGMMGMMESCPMMTAMAQGPDAAIEHRETLGLSAAQVARLEALRAGERKAQGDAMRQMMALHTELNTLAGAEQFDSAAVGGAFERMGAVHTRMGVGMVRAQHDVRAVLTPEQRTRLAAASGKTNGMSGMMSGGMKSDRSKMRGMQHCSMMGGMMGGMMQDDKQSTKPGGTPAKGAARGASREKSSDGKPAPMDHHGHQMPARTP